jgi:hypothetical protein
MADITIRIEGIDELRKKFKQAPERFNRAFKTATHAALIMLQENVQPYPRANPDSKYKRTGTLGRSLGSGEQGGKVSEPDISTVKTHGAYFTGEFGTRLKYAPYVIGDPATEQAGVHKGRWWTMVTVAQKSREKIQRVYQIAAEELRKWFDTRSVIK